MTKNRGIVGLWEERELRASSVSHLTSAASFGGSEAMLRSLGIDKTLVGHERSINALSFNSDGYMLLSGSRHGELILWDCTRRKWKLLQDHSFNGGEVCDVKFMQDGTAITSTVEGVRQIRLRKIAHARMLYTPRLSPDIQKMAFEEDNPYRFYTCSDQGYVTRFDLREKVPASKCIEINDSHGYIQFLSSICFSPTDNNLLAVAGSGTCVLIYDVRKWSNTNMSTTNGLVHMLEPNQLGRLASGISGLAYSNTGELIASYRNDNIHLFSPEQVKYTSPVNASKRPAQMVFKGHRIQNVKKEVYFLGPNCEFVASGSDTGHIYIWRKKDGALVRAMRGDNSLVNCIATCPSGLVFASGGQEKQVKIWSPESIVPNCIQKELDEAVERLNMLNVERRSSVRSISPKRDLDWLSNDLGLNRSVPDPDCGSERSDDGYSDDGSRSDEGDSDSDSDSDSSSRSDEGYSSSGSDGDSDGSSGSDIVGVRG